MVMGSRSVVPATYVPEELVTQAQVVLQGKSRHLIIRELQRTVRIKFEEQQFIFNRIKRLPARLQLLWSELISHRIHEYFFVSLL